MITIGFTTLIAGATVVLLAILGSLVNPFLRKLSFEEDDNGTLEPVTILITAHNQLAELQRNLPKFLSQQYREYQVIVVCQSTDGDTLDYLKRLTAENPHLYHTFIPESSRYMSRKKLQVTLGVKASKYEWIILTEPSCRPADNNWLTAMARKCHDSNHLVLGYTSLDEETAGVRRFENIRKAYYVLRRAQHTFGYRSHMPNVAFRKSDFMREQGYQGNLELVRGEYDFLVNKYGQCGNTEIEIAEEAWLLHEEPTTKSWRNAHLYLQASRKSLYRTSSMRALMFFDHLLPHLSLIASTLALAYSIYVQDRILAGCAGFALLLLFVLRMIIAKSAIKRFDTQLAAFVLPFYEYGIIWRNLADKLRYWRADKNDFTSHKL